MLQRFYLRVDNTLIRVYDTRIYFEVENSFVLREYSEREQEVGKLTVSRLRDFNFLISIVTLELNREVWTDHNLIVDHLPVKKTVVEKLNFKN